MVSGHQLCIDAHTHVFPTEIVENRGGFLERDEWFGSLYANPKSRLVTVESLIESMDSAGIAHSVICGFPWRDPELCDLHNGYMREVSTYYPGRLTWLGIVSPGHGRRSGQVAADLFAQGAAGLGELNADAQQFELESPRALAAAIEAAIEAGKPVMVHTSEPVGHSYPGKGTATPERLLRFLERYPDLFVVAAHWGGGLPFYELMPEVQELTGNVVYDSAATTYLYGFNVFRTVIDLVSKARVLFASDYPILRQDRLLRRVLSVNWTDEAETNAVMATNAARVYGIDLEGLTRT
jgi:predicted TIM-barrel fold metal-dependent hydrolase